MLTPTGPAGALTGLPERGVDTRAITISMSGRPATPADAPEWVAPAVMVEGLRMTGWRCDARMQRCPERVDPHLSAMSSTSDPIDLSSLRKAARTAFSGREVVICAYAFGSRVSGRPLPGSDLDIAVVVPPDLEEADPLLVERLASRLSEALGSGVDIDCRCAASLPLALQGRIITEGVMIYEGDAVGRVRFETDVRRLYFDFLPLIERDAREALKAGG